MSIITWRNVTQPNAAGAGILMNSAQQGIDRGFNTLQNVLAQRNKTEQQNWETQKANNTSDYLDAVQGITDPNQVQDPAVQANLAKMKQQFGYQVDPNLIRGAVDKRVSDLQVQGTNRIQYNDINRVDTERDAVDQISALYQAGKYAEGDALRQGQNFRDDATLDELRVKSQRGYSQEDRAEAQDGRAAASHGLSMATGNLNLQSGRLRLQDLQATNQANNVARESQAEFLKMAEDVKQGQEKVAADLGINLSKIEPGQHEVLAKALKEAGIPEMPTSSQFVEATTQRLLATGASPATVNSLRTGLAGLIGSETLTERDQNYINQEIGAVGAEYDGKIAKSTARMDKIAKSNTWLKMDTDPYEQMANIQTAVSKATETESEAEELSSKVQDLMDNGVKVDGVYNQVPPAMALAAINFAANQGENVLIDFKAGDFEKVLKNMMESPEYAKQFKEYGEYQKLQEDVRTYSFEKVAESQAAERKLRAERGSSFDGAELVQRALKNRKP